MATPHEYLAPHWSGRSLVLAPDVRVLPCADCGSSSCVETHDSQGRHVLLCRECDAPRSASALVRKGAL